MDESVATTGSPVCEPARSTVLPLLRSCDYPALSLLDTAGGRAFVKLIERAIRDY